MSGGEALKKKNGSVKFAEISINIVRIINMSSDNS